MQMILFLKTRVMSFIDVPDLKHSSRFRMAICIHSLLSRRMNASIVKEIESHNIKIKIENVRLI